MSNTRKTNPKGLLKSEKNENQGFFETQELTLNGHHTFVVRKSEKLASALYVITGFIPAEDPARLRLRTCAIELISRSTDRNDLSGPGVDSFTAKCIEIGTILETAKSGGLVSAMNAELMGREYLSLASFVQEHEEKISHRSLFHGKSLSEKDQEFYIGHKNKNSTKERIATISKAKNKGQIKMSDRVSLILDLLKNKDRISIKDVSNSIEGVGEKTLQRELLSMVQKGLLIKEGERRWSTYRKAPNQDLVKSVQGDAPSLVSILPES